MTGREELEMEVEEAPGMELGGEVEEAPGMELGGEVEGAPGMELGGEVEGAPEMEPEEGGSVTAGRHPLLEAVVSSSSEMVGIADGARGGEEDAGNIRLDPFLQPPVSSSSEMAGIADGERGSREGPEEGEDAGNIRLDPFLQPPILKAFFEQLPLEALARCRLVSKLWYELSLATWRSKVILKFRRTTSLQEFINLWEEGDWAASPFRKFYLHSWDFTPGDVEQQRFLELVGGHVTSLTLKKCSFDGRDSFRRFIYQSFPKLQFLKIIGCDNVDKNDWWDEAREDVLAYKAPAFGVHGLKSLEFSRCRPHSTMDLLSHFHKLTSLHMKGVRSKDIQELVETIRLIKAQDQTKLPLRNFDVNVDFFLGRSTASSIEFLKLLEQLCQLNIPLRRLDVHLSWGWDFGLVDDSSEDLIRNVLQRHSSTLTHLNFNGKDRLGLCNSFPFGISFERLEKLAIYTPGFSENLNFLRYTPNLRVLELQDFDLSMAQSDKLFTNSCQLEIGDWTLPSVTELKLNIPVSSCNLEKLMKWMPNVKRLQMTDLDDIKFSLVCKKWKKLEEIMDLGHELTDEGVIGKENESGGDEGTQSGSNIANLKCLTSFLSRSTGLTSASVHDGLLKLGHLKQLSLGISLDEETKAAIERQRIVPHKL